MTRHPQTPIEDRPLTRRTVLKGTAVAAAAGFTGVTAFSGGVAATDHQPHLNMDGSMGGSWPSDDEIAFLNPGYTTSPDEYPTGVDQAATAEEGAHEAGYQYEVAGFNYDLDTTLFSTAESRADDYALVLADWVNDNPQGYHTIRIFGHSLGGRVTLECLQHLDTTVDSATLLVPAVDADSVTEGGWLSSDGKYYDGIANADQVTNFYKEDDEVLDWLSDPLGQVGADGDTPDNFYEQNVTNTVEDHYSPFYTQDEGGCWPEILDQWDDPETNHDDGSSGWFGW